MKYIILLLLWLVSLCTSLRLPVRIVIVFFLCSQMYVTIISIVEAEQIMFVA